MSPADWIATSALPWQRLVTFGPAGFAAYARLRFLPDPAYPGQDETDAAVDEAWCDHDQLATLMQVLAGHTQCPDDCYVCVWEGYSDHGHELPSIVWHRGQAFDARTWPPSPLAEPALDPTTPPSQAPVVVPNRACFLFHGRPADVYHWGKTAHPWDPPAMWAGQTRLRPLHPAFVWPADHAWCVASDVDPHWAGIGADTDVIDQLVNDARLDVVPADPDAEQPTYY